MIVTDKSSIITFAIPVFMLLILIEYCYGVYKGKSNYRLNDTFTSLSTCAKEEYNISQPTFKVGL